MAAKKSPDGKVFDVAKPGVSKPDIGSKPMIIGHKSMASDPMMRETEEEQKADESAIETRPATIIKIQPVSDEANTKDSSPTPEKIELSDPKEMSKEVAPLEQAENVKGQAVTPEAAAEDGKNKPVEKDAASPDEAEAKSPAKKTSENEAGKKDDVGKNQETIDPAAVELEREDNLKKLIASKKYRLNIKETKDRSLRNVLPAAVLIILLLLGGLYAAIDSGMLDIGVKMPFHIFNSQTETEAPVVQPTPQLVASEPQKPAETAQQSAGVTIPEGFKEYKNTAYGYSISYPQTIEPYFEAMGQEEPLTESSTVLLGVIDKETLCCTLRLESVIDTQGENKQQLSDLYKQSGVKAMADESFRVNKEDNNPSIENKTVSDVKKSKRGNVDTYEFTVSASYSTGFFNDTVSGMILKKPALIIFFETSKSVIRIQTEANNSEVDTILQTLAI